MAVKGRLCTRTRIQVQEVALVIWVLDISFAR